MLTFPFILLMFADMCKPPKYIEHLFCNNLNLKFLMNKHNYYVMNKWKCKNQILHQSNYKFEIILFLLVHVSNFSNILNI